MFIKKDFRLVTYSGYSVAIKVNNRTGLVLLIPNTVRVARTDLVNEASTWPQMLQEISLIMKIVANVTQEIDSYLLIYI